MSEAATLMFGLGATRAGSTWLYRYLAGHPDCALPRVKELHYFSTMDYGGRKRQVRRLDGIARRAERRHAAAVGGRKDEIAKWRDDVSKLRALVSGDEDVPAYLNFLREGREGRVYGDITPAYSLLSEERLRMMAGLGERVKFIFMLRDPVDRLWSNICQSARIKADRRDGKATSEEVAAVARGMFARWFGGVETALILRSDYKAMLTRITQAIPRENLYVGFYERLFTNKTVAQICAFLGISDHPADFTHESNVSDKIAMAPSDRAKAQRELIGQYDYIDRFMGGDLPQRWIDNRVSASAGEMRV
ncbi:MAG: sulfotransferase [Pseudomonadota bacterium]